jgi:ornithine carbamoyltransferase
MTTRHFLEVDDLTPAELAAVLDLSAATSWDTVLAGSAVALLFEKPSLRTRNACEVAVAQLGGHPLSMHGAEVGLGKREPAADVARVLSRYHALIGARVFDHGVLHEMAGVSAVPVVNLLSDAGHPCQALADLLTLRQRFGALDGLEVAYVGDFNNVARSLAIAASMAGMRVRVACPPGHGPSGEDVERAAIALVTSEPKEAVEGADAVYTDVWTSMGQEGEAAERKQAFEGFTVDAALLQCAAPHATFLHCLPAHRGEEVAAEVVDGEQSAVWQQAENRLHSFRGLLLWLAGQSTR